MKIALALGVMATALVLVVGEDASWLAMGAGEKAWRTVVVIACAGAAYFGTLFALGFRLADFRHRTPA